jgi:hypothetical protein
VKFELISRQGCNCANKNKHFVEPKLEWLAEPDTEYVHFASHDPTPALNGCDGNVS